MTTNVSYSNATNGTVNLLNSNNLNANKQTTNLMDDFSNIFGNPSAGQSVTPPVQNNFANLFSLDSNPVMPNISEPVKAVNANNNSNQFDLLSGFLNMDANSNQIANNNINSANNANTGFNLLGVNSASSSAPAGNTNDLLSSLGLVRDLLLKFLLIKVKKLSKPSFNVLTS